MAESIRETAAFSAANGQGRGDWWGEWEIHRGAGMPEPGKKGKAMEASDLLPNAIAYAHEKHRGQKDRQGLPYILHPMAVMVNLVNHERYAALSPADRADACCIAVLHDVVEDTDGTLEEIRNLLGRREITDGVDAMTQYDGETLESYWTRAKNNRLARIVKLCDIRHNSEPSRAMPDPDHRRRLSEKYARAEEFLRFRPED